METSVQRAQSVMDDSILSTGIPQEVEAEEQHHIHLPNPSIWPFLLSGAILLTVVGLMFIPDVPWTALAGGILTLASILGWALEDPMASHDEVREAVYVYDPHISPRQVVERAEEALDHSVTVSSTAYSVHPVKVEIDSIKDNGVVLALYGKVELEAQRDQIERAMRALPNVLAVRNFLIAEDEILGLANAKLESLRSKGKLEGSNVSLLVENYILHLYGEVPTSDLKYSLEREMIGVPGVRVVVNHIGLNKEIPGNLGKTRNKI